jgi:restriction endonuclease Mrr
VRGQRVGSLILVDGKRLVSLLIEHGVGVAVASTLTVPKVDYDDFEG